VATRESNLGMWWKNSHVVILTLEMFFFKTFISSKQAAPDRIDTFWLKLTKVQVYDRLLAGKRWFLQPFKKGDDLVMKKLQIFRELLMNLPRGASSPWATLTIWSSKKLRFLVTGRGINLMQTWQTCCACWVFFWWKVWKMRAKH